MKPNVGKIDQMVRLGLGAVFSALGLGTLAGLVTRFGRTAGIVLLILAIMLLYSGFTRNCRFYEPFDIDTSQESEG